MTLSIEDLQKIQSAFRECYQTLFKAGQDRLRRTISIKLKAIQYFQNLKKECDSHGGKQHTHGFEFSPVNLEDVDEYSDEFYLSEDSESDDESE